MSKVAEKAIPKKNPSACVKNQVCRSTLKSAFRIVCVKQKGEDSGIVICIQCTKKKATRLIIMWCPAVRQCLYEDKEISLSHLSHTEYYTESISTLLRMFWSGFPRFGSHGTHEREMVGNFLHATLSVAFLDLATRLEASRLSWCCLFPGDWGCWGWKLRLEATHQ